MHTTARIWFLLVGVVAAIYAAGAVIAPLTTGCQIALRQEDFGSTRTAAPGCMVFVDVPVIAGVALLAVLTLMAVAWSVSDGPPRGVLARIGIIAGLIGSFIPAFLLASLFGPGRASVTPTEIALGGIPAALGIMSAVVLWRRRGVGAVSRSAAA